MSGSVLLFSAVLMASDACASASSSTISGIFFAESRAAHSQPHHLIPFDGISTTDAHSCKGNSISMPSLAMESILSPPGHRPVRVDPDA